MECGFPSAVRVELAIERTAKNPVRTWWTGRIHGHPVALVSHARFTGKSASLVPRSAARRHLGQASWLMADSDGTPPSHPHWADSGLRRHPASRGCQRESVSPITVARPHRICTGFPFVPHIPQVIADVFRRSTGTRITDRCWLECSVVNADNLARQADVVNLTVCSCIPGSHQLAHSVRPMRWSKI